MPDILKIFKLLYKDARLEAKLVHKVRLALVILLATVEYLWKFTNSKSRESFNKILTRKLQAETKIIKIKYGESILFLTYEDLFQGVNIIGRKSGFPLGQFISAGDIVCDVGAHIGTHSIKYAEIVKDKGKVICLEPNLRNFGLLCLNIHFNRFSNYVMPIRAALSTRCGKIKLYDVGGSTHFSTVRKSDRFEEVDTINFEKLFEFTKVSSFDFMKIDIEGAESDLIPSEIDTFRNKKIKVLYIDGHEGVDYNLIIGHLNKFGYHWRKFEGGYVFYLDASSLNN